MQKCRIPQFDCKSIIIEKTNTARCDIPYLGQYFQCFDQNTYYIIYIKLGKRFLAKYSIFKMGFAQLF